MANRAWGVVGGFAVALGSLLLLSACGDGETPKAARRDPDFTNSLGMEFVRIPPGEFRMGTTEEEMKAVLAKYPKPKKEPFPPREEQFASEKPAHKVRLTKAFLMGKHEVTVGQFRKFIEATGYKTDAETGAGGDAGAVVWPEGSGAPKPADASWRKPYTEQTEAHPVVCVSWNDARKFVEWLNGSDKGQPEGWLYRLPTEAEWEYAARGPKSLIYPWGNEWDPKRCNFAGKGTGFYWDMETDDGFPRTAPVGSFSPKGDSPFGACDMAGNVSEWCEDRDGAYGAGDQADPTGPASGSSRVWRGDCWHSHPWLLRSAHRSWYSPEYRDGLAGFRVVLAPGPQ